MADLRIGTAADNRKDMLTLGSTGQLENGHGERIAGLKNIKIRTAFGSGGPSIDLSAELSGYGGTVWKIYCENHFSGEYNYAEFAYFPGSKDHTEIAQGGSTTGTWSINSNGVLSNSYSGARSYRVYAQKVF